MYESKMSRVLVPPLDKILIKKRLSLLFLFSSYLNSWLDYNKANIVSVVELDSVHT